MEDSCSLCYKWINFISFFFIFIFFKKGRKGENLPLFWKRAYFHGLFLDVYIAPDSINLKGFELLNSFSRKISKSGYQLFLMSDIFSGNNRALAPFISHCKYLFTNKPDQERKKSLSSLLIFPTKNAFKQYAQTSWLFWNLSDYMGKTCFACNITYFIWHQFFEKHGHRNSLFQT